MSGAAGKGDREEHDLAKIKRRCRVLLLLDAAEKAGIAPLSSARFHALAYLADVLSPVWELVPFDGKIYKSEGGPHYPELQEAVDSLVVLGLVEAMDLAYEQTAGGARISAAYGLNFESKFLEPILEALGARLARQALDPEDGNFHAFLVELAGALGTLRDDEIELATCADVTYRVGADANDVVDFAEWAKDRWRANPSWQAAERFQRFLPADLRMLSGEKLYLYAAYLKRAMHGD